MRGSRSLSSVYSVWILIDSSRTQFFIVRVPTPIPQGYYVLTTINPFPVVVGCTPTRLGMLRAVLTAPVTPAHRSKASGGRDWVSPRGPKASLGSFRRSARTLALAVRVV